MAIDEIARGENNITPKLLRNLAMKWKGSIYFIKMSILALNNPIVLRRICAGGLMKNIVWRDKSLTRMRKILTNIVIMKCLNKNTKLIFNFCVKRLKIENNLEWFFIKNKQVHQEQSIKVTKYWNLKSRLNMTWFPNMRVRQIEKRQSYVGDTL